MIDIPDQITIGGYEYAIELVQNMASDGEVRCRELLIRIDREMAQRRQLGTLLHEIVHAVSDDVLREGKAESN